MPTLNWIGKDKVVNHHQQIPFRVMKHGFGFENGNQSSKPADSNNLIIHGDNLEALKSLLPKYEGMVSLIYIDPPYNTGNEKWAYNDNVNDPHIQKWLNQVVGSISDDLSRHDKWLCMMYPRLQLLHKLLKKDGVIMISLDENETHHLRSVMNEIFGENNFVAQLTLLCNPKGRSQDKYFSTNHEYITIYSKSVLPKDSFSVVKTDEAILKEYKKSDADGKYRLLELRNTHREFGKFNRPNLYYPIYVNPENQHVKLEPDKDFNIKVLPNWSDGFEGCWTWGTDLAKSDNHLLIGRKIKGNWKVYRKDYASDSEGGNVKKKLFTILQDSMFYTEKGQALFGEIFPGFSKTDFPQPKSVDLIAQLIETCTDDSDIILDSFAGSGTTGHATLKVNKDGKNRSFIMIEREDYADTITAERMRRVINGYGTVNGLKGGFNFYTLGEGLLDEQNELNDKISESEIREYVFYTETKQSIQTGISKDKNENKYFLGNHDGTDYYFIYEKNQITTLNPQFLKTIREIKSNKIIYADNCLLSKELLQKNNIIFKKIPRDITKF